MHEELMHYNELNIIALCVTLIEKRFKRTFFILLVDMHDKGNRIYSSCAFSFYIETRTSY